MTVSRKLYEGICNSGEKKTGGKEETAFFSDSSERVLADLRGARALTKALTGRGQLFSTDVLAFINLG